MGKYTKLALTVNIVVFSLIFLLHLFRLITGSSAQFAGWTVSMWLSYVALVISAFLIYLNYKAL